MNPPEPMEEPSRVVAQPAVIRRRRYFSVVWVVPLVAAIVAGYLVFRHLDQAGPHITIRFADGSGLKPGQSVLKYRGVIVGQVRSISLSQNLRTVQVEARLDKSAATLAREGSVFWIVRPEVSVANITGLGTIISGPFIEVIPGSGPARRTFEGAANSPAKHDEHGLQIVLMAPHRGSLRIGSPVFYRGIEVGMVREQRLSEDARAVEFDVFVQQRYEALVRGDSKFWNVSGVDVDFSLFKGAQVNVESLKSLISGGVAFATPPLDKTSEPVKDGMVFRLYEESKKEWLEWSPAISIQTQPQRAAVD
jgi:paraquat-inducible protein B